MRRWLARLLMMATVLVAVTGALAYAWLLGSLPQLEGELSVTAIAAPVTVRRDRQGIVLIEARNRADIGFALGYVHAQERFFQMDLQRRSAAGELAELFGSRALPHDREVRTHRFRHRARQNLHELPADEREILDRYSAGINAGLAALRSRPMEYGLLRLKPAPWRPEDSMLTVFSMALVLQDREARFERGLGLMADVLPPDWSEFWTRQGGEWDASLAGDDHPPAPIPETALAALPGAETLRIGYSDDHITDEVPGSNNWAVAGRLTTHGAALVANDMHLPIRVPNIWFRAAWNHPDTGHLVSGVTLPGVPSMVAGSNGRVAWGFTNTQGDWSDVVVLRTSDDGTRYLVPGGSEPFFVHRETLRIKGAAAETIEVRATRWGPVIGRNHRGELLALRWVAHDRQGIGGSFARLETMGSVDEAVLLAPELGIPHQNFVVGDREGNIAWTIAGPVPRRAGLDGRQPSRWDRPDRGWDGYLDAAEHPRVVNPPSGRIWTANARVASGEDYRHIGMQGAALGARQGQIRDGLAARDRFDEADMLALQLDDRALFLERWRTRLLEVLEDPAVAGDEALLAARAFVLDWTGRADRDDVGYRLVREFRLETIERVTAPLESYLRRHEDRFRLSHVGRMIEYPVWALLTARPGHLLNPDFDSWRALELDAARGAVAPLFADGRLDDDTWGEANRLRVRHPLAGALTPLDWWLSMPDEPMHGDTYMPRVQRPSFAASERFAVSPGRESEAFLHMATGQSAHPLSPFFGAGHEDWVEGRASPLLPTNYDYELKLLPANQPDAP